VKIGYVKAKGKETLQGGKEKPWGDEGPNGLGINSVRGKKVLKLLGNRPLNR